jgi:DCN1-like protein 4/5
MILSKQLYLGAEQVNEKQNRKRKGVSTNLTSRKAQRGELH